MRKLFVLFSLVIAASLLLAACGTQTTPAPQATEPQVEPTAIPATEVPTEPAWTAPEGALVAIPVEAAPSLDGVGDEAFWAGAAEIVLPLSGGANFDGTGSSEVTMKSVYTEDSVYFLVTWTDPTESFLRSPWQKQEDGTWLKVKDPNDKGGDNNTVYEDKFAFIWPINNSIKGFETAGCFTACHAGENSDAKPYGNKYTASEGELGDIWHWKSIRNLNQVDDQYLDAVRYSTDTKEAGRHSDPKDSGGYTDNVNETKDGPGFTSPSIDPVTGMPGFILDSEKLPVDPAAIAAGQYVPGIIISKIVGDRGDLSAGWKYADGKWTLEFGRKLVTGSQYDVQFDDLTAAYYFGVAAFDNAQVRHAFQVGVSTLVFMPK